MGKRHTRLSRAWQRPGVRGGRDGTGRTLLVGLVLFAWLAATPAAPTRAATSGSASPTMSDVDTPPEYLRAAVTLDGKDLFYVRGISSYPAARRAREISERIRKIAAIRPSLPIRSAQLKTRSTPILSPATGLS